MLRKNKNTFYTRLEAKSGCNFPPFTTRSIHNKAQQAAVALSLTTFYNKVHTTNQPEKYTIFMRCFTLSVTMMFTFSYEKPLNLIVT